MNSTEAGCVDPMISNFNLYNSWTRKPGDAFGYLQLRRVNNYELVRCVSARHALTTCSPPVSYLTLLARPAPPHRFRRTEITFFEERTARPVSLRPAWRCVALRGDPPLERLAALGCLGCPPVNTRAQREPRAAGNIHGCALSSHCCYQRASPGTIRPCGKCVKFTQPRLPATPSCSQLLPALAVASHACHTRRTHLTLLDRHARHDNNVPFFSTRRRHFAFQGIP